jgi:hypothetical protein
VADRGQYYLRKTNHCTLQLSALLLREVRQRLWHTCTVKLTHTSCRKKDTQKQFVFAPDQSPPFSTSVTLCRPAHPHNYAPTAHHVLSRTCLRTITPPRATRGLDSSQTPPATCAITKQPHTPIRLRPYDSAGLTTPAPPLPMLPSALRLLYRTRQLPQSATRSRIPHPLGHSPRGQTQAARTRTSPSTSSPPLRTRAPNLPAPGTTR